MDITLVSRKNKQLNAYGCYKLEGLLKSNLTVAEIAVILCRSKSTIYRELKRVTLEFRNSDCSVRKEYSAYYSLNVRQELMSKTGRKLLYQEVSPELLSYIQHKLDDNYSPDAITGGLRKARAFTVCPQTIYNYISLGILKRTVYKRHTGQAKNKARIAYRLSKKYIFSTVFCQPNNALRILLGYKGN